MDTLSLTACLTNCDGPTAGSLLLHRFAVCRAVESRKTADFGSMFFHACFHCTAHMSSRVWAVTRKLLGWRPALNLNRF